MFDIHLLPASYGDSILLEYGNRRKYYILIDAGPYTAFEELVPALRRAAPSMKRIELLVVTHIDTDHIDGAILLLNRDKLPFVIGEVWYNGWNEISTVGDDILGSLQGEYLSTLITRWGLPHNTRFNGKQVMVSDYASLPGIRLPGGMVITLLGPGPGELKALIPGWVNDTTDLRDEEAVKARLEKDPHYDKPMDDLLGDEYGIEDLQQTIVKADKSETNASSIAMLATYRGKSCLLPGDATTLTLLAAIEPLLQSTGRERLTVDAWKLAHHGSRKNTMEELMEKIECKRILVSSDGKKFGHPNADTLARMLKFNGPGLTFYFNYLSDVTKRWNDQELQEEYSFRAVFPEEGSPGISLSL